MTLQAIASIGYSGELAYECRLSGPVDEVLPISVRRMREAAPVDPLGGDRSRYIVDTSNEPREDRVIMTWTYAAAGPWLGFEQGCGPGTRDAVADLFARMTGHSGHRGRRSFGSWAMWGGPPWGPMWTGGGRGPKARRGDVRAAILAVLAEQPMNGYQIIQEVAERSGGVWKPSPGSIYPTLQQLEDEGLVRAESDGGRRAYALTEEGRTYVAEHPDEVAAPWAGMSEADRRGRPEAADRAGCRSDLADRRGGHPGAAGQGPRGAERPTPPAAHDPGRRRVRERASMTDPRTPPQIQLWTWPTAGPAGSWTGRPPALSRCASATPSATGRCPTLGDHFAAGRLTREEFDARVDQAMAARFDSDLQPLFVDLPRAEPVPTRPAGAAARPARRLAAAALVAAVAAGGAVVVAVLLSAPWLIWTFCWVLLMSAFWGRRRHHYRRHRQYHRYPREY